MPLVDERGPSWTRPIVRRAEKRLAGLGPVLTFFARIFRRRPVTSPSAEREAAPEERDAAN